jgi:hypothetical protein
MAKRFTDSDKWKRPFFNKLTNEAKLAWFYLLDNCDSSGVWHCDFGLMSYQLKFEVLNEDLIRWFGNKVFFMDDDKIFIESFVDFQYGELNPANNAHKPVIKVVEKISSIKVLRSPLLGAQDKDTDKDLDKDKERKSDDDFLSAYLLSFDSFAVMRSVSKKTKTLWLDLYGDPDFILRSVASAMPRYENLMPAKQNPEVFFTDQLKFDWPHHLKHQKQNTSPGGMVKAL